MTIHFAHLVSGIISPLCAARPRPLDLARETWTLSRSMVRCAGCAALLPPKVEEDSEEPHEQVLESPRKA